MLVPLLYDDNYFVARAAVNSAGTIGGDDFFVPTLAGRCGTSSQGAGAQGARRLWRGRRADPGLLPRRQRGRHLGAASRAGDARPHPCDASVKALVSALDSDGFLRFKAVTALEQLRRENLELAIERGPIERNVMAELNRGLARSRVLNLFLNGPVSPTCLLARVLEEKRERAVNQCSSCSASCSRPRISPQRQRRCDDRRAAPIERG